MFPAGETGTTMKVQKYGFLQLVMAAAEWLLIMCNSPHLVAAEEGAAAIIGDRRHDENSDLRYEKVRFTITYETTADDYAKLIKDIINHLASGSLSNEIPLLRPPSSLPVQHPSRFLLVEMTNNAQETVTLAIDATNVYVVGYQAGERSYFFRDAPAGANTHLFQGTTGQTLSYGGSYGDLEGQAGTDRDQIELGTEALIRSVSSLFHATSSRTQARSFIVVIQMICEAARFRDIALRVRRSVRSGESFLPDRYMLSLETSWGQQSTRVQQSVGGAFTTPLTLQVATGTYTTLRHVRDVVASLALMLFVCRDRSSIMSSHGHDDQNKLRHYPDRPLLIKSVVENDDTCPNWEPTMRISGRDGLCVDVRDGAYNNGNPIQLWPCKTNEDPNQLWTIRSDGTIRSNGRCLTTYGYAHGNYVMIFDCNTAVTAATRWEIWDNGTIINPQSALVLGAGGGGNSGTTLTVQTNVYASQQGWVVSNGTSPREVTIVGFRDLCMQENGPAMWLEKCVSGKQEQIWTLYGDGSIRPKQNQDRCLTCLRDSTSTLVTIESCSTGSSGQRWVFTNEGTIFNLNNGMVMDVRQSDPSLGEIIIYPITGNPNQEWFPLPA